MELSFKTIAGFGGGYLKISEGSNHVVVLVDYNCVSCLL